MQEKKKAVMALARKAITHFNKNSYSNLEINVNIKFCAESYFIITVFENNEDLDNRSFYFHFGESEEARDIVYTKLMIVLKEDDFQKIIDLSGLDREQYQLVTEITMGHSKKRSIY